VFVVFGQVFRVGGEWRAEWCGAVLCDGAKRKGVVAVCGLTGIGAGRSASTHLQQAFDLHVLAVGGETVCFVHQLLISGILIRKYYCSNRVTVHEAAQRGASAK